MADHATQAGAAIRQAGALDSHANNLAVLGDRLSVMNERLASLLSRLSGPSPSPGQQAAKDVSPAGVLHVAAFAAERISREIDTLTALVEQLERVA